MIMTESAGNNDQLEVTNVIWNLADLYENETCDQFTKDFDWCEAEATALSGEYRTRLSELTSPELLTLIQRLQTLDSRIAQLATYGFLNYCTQIDNEKAGALYQRIQELSSRCSKETVFFELEWNRLPEETVITLLSDECLDTFRHYLTSMRRYRPHQLEEIEERLLIETETVGRKSWTILFEKVMGNLRFGEAQRTQEQVLTDLYNPDRTIRKNAAHEFTQGLRDQNHILTHIYNTLAADKMITDRLRSHSLWVSSMNLDNQLTDDTVETLISSVTARYDLVSRYYKLKARLLSLDKLCDYDRYAPLPSLPSELVVWDDCSEMVLDSFFSFSEELGRIAQSFFDKSWIHAPVIPGKRGGAFAHPCVPDVHPYVLVNFSGTLRDVSTVAHELGHGVHQVLASRKGYYNSHTPLVLAETASVFAELLVFKSQLAHLKSTEGRRAFICQKLESIFATVFRQVAMNRFENLMHNGRREKGELSSDQLSSYWIETQNEMFQDSVSLTENYHIWWSYIPHFLSTPGYVYSYAFGELLVLALYGIYQQKAEEFVAQYIELLSAGGSNSPYELLQPFGIDLNSKTFWDQGLNVIESLLREVEE